jgi:hypothetical protein
LSLRKGRSEIKKENFPSNTLNIISTTTKDKDILVTLLNQVGNYQKQQTKSIDPESLNTHTPFIDG